MPQPLLLANAKVAGAPEEPAREAIALGGGRILAVGALEAVRHLAGPGAIELDLGGRRVVPGLIDSHAHVLRAGLTWDRQLRWDEAHSLEQALDLVRRRAAELGANAWIPVLGGWHEGQFAEARPPTRDDLDRVAPDNPCYVQRLYSYAVLNSAALARCGLHSGAPDPPGGEIERDAEGRPTGVVRGLGGFRHCYAAMGEPSLEEQVRSMRALLGELAGYGLTGAIDPGGVGVGPETYEPLYEVWRRGELGVRIRLYLGAGTPGRERREIEDWLRFLPRGFGDGLLRVTGIGEIIVFGCWDRDGIVPFAIEPESLAEFTEISRLVAARGWPMHVHAIRDASAGAILDAWEAVARDRPLEDLRFSLAHAEQIGAPNLARARALGVGIAVQNRIALRAADSARAWGEEAVRNAPPLARLLELGLPVGAGTDATVVNSIDPWRALSWLVTGETLDGGPARAPAHRLSRAQALDLYTRGSAWFSFEEACRGVLAPGFEADLAVLSADYFGVPASEIATLRSELTVVAGAVTHASASFAGVADAIEPSGR